MPTRLGPIGVVASVPSCRVACVCCASTEDRFVPSIGGIVFWMVERARRASPCEANGFWIRIDQTNGATVGPK